MLLCLRCLLFCVLGQLFFVSVFGQHTDTASIYNKVINIDNDTLPSHLYKSQASYEEMLQAFYSKKLEAIYRLKRQTEFDKATNDSGYIVALIKAAKYEYLAHKKSNFAIQYSLQALQIIASAPHTISEKHKINATYNLATYYYNSSQFSKALLYFDTVILLCKQADPDDYIILSRYNKTSLFFSLTDYQKASDESTLGIAETLKRNDLKSYASFLNFRSQSQIFLGNFEQANRDVETAIPIEEKTNNLYELSNSFEVKALICDTLKKFKEAELYYKKAIRTCPIQSEYMKTIATDYNYLANFYFLSLQNLSKAKENYFNTIQYSNQCDSADRTALLFMAYRNLGVIFLKENNYDSAVRYYTLACNQTNLKTSNFLFTDFNIQQLSIIEYKALIFDLLSDKTSLLLYLFKKTNQVSYLKACMRTAKLADTLITKIRHENITENSKLIWRGITRNFFSNAIDASFQLNDINSAFIFMEKSRAVLLNDKWNELNANAHLLKKEADTETFFKLKIIEQQRQLAVSKPSSYQYNDIKNSLLQTNDSLEHFIKSLENKYPVYYQMKYADNVPPLSALQDELKKNNQSFVYYFMSDTAMYVLNITPNKSRFIKINNNEFDSRQLSQFIHLCSNKQMLMSHYDTYCSLAQHIYRKLFQPLNIPKGNVAICTDAFFIPFEALCTDDKGKNYLLYNYDFSYVYSARAMFKIFHYSVPSGNFIGFAPVSFSPSLNVVDLKQSASALQDAARFYDNNILFTQEEATHHQFIDQAPRYAVVTIFSHAKADTTGAEPELFMEDSVIHLSELQRLTNPSIQFVLLSACQTNIGRNATGEGIYSLARGFAAAGIPAVSATLWKADEGAVYEISIKFNEYLSKGMDKSEALRKAKIWYLQSYANSESCLPYYWANMVLIGSSQPLHLRTGNHVWLWMAAIILPLVLLLFGILFYKKKMRKMQY